LAAIESRLAGEITAGLELAGQKLQTLLASSVFRNPLLPVHNREQELDDLQTAMRSSMRELLAQAQRKLAESYEQVRKIEPHRLLGGKMVSLKTWEHKAQMAVQSILNKATQILRDKTVGLKDAIVGLLADARQQFQFNCEEIARVRPERILRKKTVELGTISNAANTAMKTVINRLQIQLTEQESKLITLDPKSVLQRGYSITTSQKTGLVVRDLGDIEIGDLLVTELARENLIESKVTKK
jgi:exonuclease VII large subunit